MTQKEKKMDIWSLVIVALSIVVGGLIRFVCPDPKVLFVLAMVVLLLIVGYLSYYAGAAFKSRKNSTPRERRITALLVAIIFFSTPILIHLFLPMFWD